LRGANGDKGVAGTRHRFTPGFGADAIYDAFVATSTPVMKVNFSLRYHNNCICTSRSGAMSFLYINLPGLP